MSTKSDDYYDELHITYLLREHQRVLVEKKIYENLILIKNSDDTEPEHIKRTLETHL